MSIRVVLDSPPEFYTNLDFISGRVVIALQRPETIGNIIVKLEGEARTALTIAPERRHERNEPGDVVTENHKVLYRVFQVYPDDALALSLPPGQHEFKFNFKVPLNNICHDARAISAIMGVGGVGGVGNAGILGKGGFRTMDGTKQLILTHVKATLPPSITGPSISISGLPLDAQVRYYIKVTVQRPGIFKENWRHELGFRFLPIEPPRPDSKGREAFARRPFVFKPHTPLSSKKSFFSSKPARSPNGIVRTPPSFEMCARLPFPSILTCNQPIPLRLIAKKLVAAHEQAYLTRLEITLVGYTEINVANNKEEVSARWVVVSALNLLVALGMPADPVDTEFEVPNTCWASQRLPNTVAPTFRTCNIKRRYELEINLSLSWGTPEAIRAGGVLPQIISLPLRMSNIEVFSGVKPPAQLLQTATATAAPTWASMASSSSGSTNISGMLVSGAPPRMPSRPSGDHRPSIPPRPSDPMYPPQLAPGESAHDDAPPSYDEAVAESLALAGPRDRPAYSGVTAEEDAPTGRAMPSAKS
ncbi:hypothetical protein F5Y14DRAFT_217940 [Nemania sp. NC0429]|nr:hypothetical protein F5Y14DRAFT_217940 [Nemania sp. NC0429]